MCKLTCDDVVEDELITRPHHATSSQGNSLRKDENNHHYDDDSPIVWGTLDEAILCYLKHVTMLVNLEGSETPMLEAG
jgi:hypothetical protein